MFAYGEALNSGWNDKHVYSRERNGARPFRIHKLLPEVRTLVNKVVKKNMADGFLFSAGTDTQIIAYEAVKYKPDIPCLTLAFKHGAPKDTEYVKENG